MGDARRGSVRRLASVLLPAVLTSACATLGQLGAIVQPPRFQEAPDRPSELRLLGPADGLPLGGAGLRLWVQVTNPNGFGFTLAHLSGELFLENARATTVDLPLGLPLLPRGDATFPIDLRVSFTDLPGLGDVVRRAIGRQPIAYRLDGTVGVEAGRFGTPRFGPMTVVRGTVR
jgi:hypothetical protein